MINGSIEVMEVAAKGYDLTKGSILGRLLLIAMPVMATQLFQMLFNLIDMFFVGRISSDAVAAVGSAGMYIWLSVAFFVIGGRGAEIGVSQSIGNGDEQEARRFATAAIGIAVALGSLYGLLMFSFAGFWIGLLRLQEAHVVADAVMYLRVISISFPFMFLNNAITGIYNGLGNSRLPFYVKSIGLTINVIITPIFIFVLDLGVRGAAMATAIGFTLMGLMLILTVKMPKLCPFDGFRFRDVLQVEMKNVKQIFKWTLPMTVDSGTFTLLSMVIAGFVAQFGSDAVAAQRVGTQIESLSWLVGGGYAVAFTAFIGQNHGAKEWGRIRRGFKISTVVKILWGLGVGLIMFFGGEWLFNLFIDEPTTVAIGVSYMRILAVVQIPQCMEHLCAGAFDGAGNTMPPTIVSMTFNFLRVVVAYFLSQTALGLDGIWIAIALGNLTKGVFLTAWYLLWSRKTKLQRDQLTAI